MNFCLSITEFLSTNFSATDLIFENETFSVHLSPHISPFHSAHGISAHSFTSKLPTFYSIIEKNDSLSCQSETAKLIIEERTIARADIMKE